MSTTSLKGPFPKRSKFLRTCLDKELSHDTIMQLIGRINSVPEEEREAKAEEIRLEIEAE